MENPDPEANAGNQLSQIHMDLASRIHEVEMQNSEILRELAHVRTLLQEFKNTYDHKMQNEKDTDILLRKVGILK